MESTQIQALYEPPPAAMPQLSEKPRQGFETRKTAGKPGSNSCNFTVTLGLQATVVENGVRGTYSARYYNPQSGRFLSRDPQDGNPRDPVTLHKYLYAGGDPINWFDPTGREADEEYGLTSGISTLNNVLVEGGSKVSQTEKAVNALAQLGCDIATSYSLSADTLNAVLWVFGYGDLAKKAIPPPPSPVQALCGWATLAGGGGL